MPDDRQPRRRRRAPGVVSLVLALLVAVILASLLAGGGREHTYTGFLADVSAGRVARASIDTEHQTVEVTPKHGASYQTGLPDNSEQQVVRELRSHGAQVAVQGKGDSSLTTLLVWLLPIAAVLGLAMLLLRRSGAGSAASGIMQMRKSQARRVGPERPRTTFADVAGAEEAIEELAEIKEFLTDPKRFQALGAQIPKGVLLLGPPGTGKTLLARAVAGEAGVPFFSGSGSDFVEMFVGVGASRVRDLFRQAKENAPCIVFVDEIDAVGRQRGTGMGGGHDEREQTLNQILVEMDGFEPNDNVIVIAATNRPDVLDPALLRPGRFDRHITVDRPDRAGRRAVLRVHTRGKPLAAGVDLDLLAGQTPGLTGADLANVVNEAALLAARARRPAIGQPELEEAMLRVIAGPEKKTRVMSEEERLVTAYHEMGHAIVGHVLEHAHPVRKISIVSRGRALGFTMSMPDRDSYLTTEQQLAEEMAMALGGRTAEELVFGAVTSGAADDLDRVTASAKRMVMRFGMSRRLAPRTFGHDESEPFLGRDAGSSGSDYSDRVAQLIDIEIARMVDAAHDRARKVLESHRAQLDIAARRLVEQETLEGAELEAILDEQPVEVVAGPAAWEQTAPRHHGAGRARRWWEKPLGRPRLALLRAAGAMRHGHVSVAPRRVEAWVARSPSRS